MGVHEKIMAVEMSVIVKVEGDDGGGETGSKAGVGKGERESMHCVCVYVHVCMYVYVCTCAYAYVRMCRMSVGK